MIVDYIDAWYLPQIVVWMDWQLYAHANIFIPVFVLANLAWLFDKKSRTFKYPAHIVFHIAMFFIWMRIIYGPGVG